ncbi:hypothetical protein [Streptomyces microflavus]|uniref:hypothetical protein n=1 Tax=Streptomyces microflavus TaxID=1919 RepID=UPI003F4DC6EC
MRLAARADPRRPQPTGRHRRTRRPALRLRDLILGAATYARPSLAVTGDVAQELTTRLQAAGIGVETEHRHVDQPILT